MQAGAPACHSQSLRDVNVTIEHTLAQGRARELAKGPILFLARTGNTWRQSVIDNDTWRIRDGGTGRLRHRARKPCRRPPREGAPSRPEVIRKGLRNN